MSPLVITLIILAITIIMFLSGKVSFGAVSGFIIIALTVTKVLKPAEALAGFSNTNVAMFVAMFIVGAALTKTSLLDRAQVIVVKYKHNPVILVAMSSIVASIIAILTSAVASAAIMIPLLVGISKEANISRSKLLFPAMICANMAVGLTILGQGATNMTWSDVMLEAGGTIPFTILDFTIARLPILIICIIYASFVAWRILPDAKDEITGEIKESKKNCTLTPTKEKLSFLICGATIFAMFFATTLKMDMWIIAAIGALLLVMTGVLSQNDAFASIHLPTVFLFAGVLPLSSAIAKTGAGEVVADMVIQMIGGSTNPYYITFIFILVPLILTQVMSNLATIAIFIPLAATVAVKIGIDPRAAVMACFIATCTSILTPMASPNQAMIMGPGGYSLKDYFKAGLPITIIIVVFSIFWLPFIYPFYS